MKNILLTLLAFLFGLTAIQAQRVALTFNVSSFDIDQASAGNTTINYQGSTSLLGNLRIFTDNKWAFRLGAGVDNLRYRVGDDITTNYSAVRQDVKGLFGLEKHFILGRWLDIYPGAYIPITVTGDNIIQENFDNINGGNIRPGIGVVLGANVRVLKIFRVGVEFDASYDHFKEAVWESTQNQSFVPIRGLNHSTAFTIGVAF